MTLQTSQRWLKSQKGTYIVITYILMMLETVITSELFGQIYEDLEKGILRGQDVITVSKVISDYLLAQYTPLTDSSYIAATSGIL